MPLGAIHAAADVAAADVAAPRWPFDEPAWHQALPTDLLMPTALPPGCDTP